MNHFYFGSEINSVSVSGKTVEEAKELVSSQLQAYTLDLKERDGKSEQIKANDIALKYDSEKDFQNFKDEQNPLAWLSQIVDTKDSKLDVGISYDEKLLKERIDKLSCFDSANIVEPKNSSLQYTNNSYTIVEEIKGSKVDKDALYKQIVNAILKKETALDLEAADCYVKPEYASKSQKVIEAKDMLNKYVTANITYKFGEQKAILDGSTINKWLTVDEKFEVKLNEEEVKKYVTDLSKNYNTVGKDRSFNTSSGSTITVGGGDYGWRINTSKEAENLAAAVKAGQTISKEPEYTQTALSHGSSDIGNTYVEIDLTKQHVWFYKNGSLVVQGDVVTGNVSKGNSSPKGVYKLKYKQKDAVLKGQDYASPVKYWMPFNGNIGLHDASWRNAFGGNIYLTSGSHGCVNCPYELAQTIFENITPGTPVVCY